ncbi:MAG: DNA photolyase, partial [Pseudomonadota bacterium]
MSQLPLFDLPDLKAVTWTPEVEAARRRLDAFVGRAGRAYAGARNFDFGPQDRSNTSALSPWIRSRILTEEEVLRATLRHHSASAAEKFIQEVFWRGYFKGWLEQKPSVWTQYCADLQRLKAEPPDALAAATEGRT